MGEWKKFIDKLPGMGGIHSMWEVVKGGDWDGSPTGIQNLDLITQV